MGLCCKALLLGACSLPCGAGVVHAAFAGGICLPPCAVLLVPVALQSFGTPSAGSSMASDMQAWSMVAAPSFYGILLALAQLLQMAHGPFKALVAADSFRQGAHYLSILFQHCLLEIL